jgi:hypothetical protein
MVKRRSQNWTLLGHMTLHCCLYMRLCKAQMGLYIVHFESSHFHQIVPAAKLFPNNQILFFSEILPVVSQVYSFPEPRFQ